jgi:hypothetical protein
MAKITEVMANLLRSTVVKACKRFRPRIEAMVKAGGDFFKQNHSPYTSEQSVKI